MFLPPITGYSPLVGSASGESAHSVNQGRQIRGMEKRRLFDQEQAIAGAPATGGPLANPAFQGLFQALEDQGADKLRTGAAAGWQEPGFFDVQDRDSQQRQSLASLLNIKDMNQYGRIR